MSRLVGIGIVYRGENEPNVYAVKALGEVLRDFQLIESLEDCRIQVLTGDDIHKLGVKFAKLEKEDPIKNALIYIGERFKDSLNKDDLNVFAMSIASAIAVWNVRIAGNFIDLSNEKSLLMNAIKIVATAPVVTISRSVRQKYHITPRVIDIIKAAYNHDYM